jgi:hypothetical protein
MNRIRPLVGALLTTLMLSPLSAPLLPAVAAEVELLPPGGGLDGTGPAVGTGPTDGLTPAVPVTSSGREGGSSDYVPEPTLQTRHFGLNVTLSCAVAGRANAIVVINQSAEDLPPGTRIKWQLKSEGKRGFFALLSPLPSGETLVADNVLDAAADKAAACVARVI